MFEKLIRFAIAQRWLVMLSVLGMTALGVFSYQRLPIDAVPDITNVQVQINTEAPGYSPLESEQRVSFAIETAMAGLPRLEQTRSLSRYGLSQVTVVFKEGPDIYFARQLVNERIQEAKGKLPAGLAPTLGPIATGLGEIYMWTVEAKPGALKADGTPYTPTDLREIHRRLKDTFGYRFALAYSYFAAYVLAPLLIAARRGGFHEAANHLEKNWLVALRLKDPRWRVLDVFDAITPEIATTHTRDDVEQWMHAAGIAGVRRTAWCDTSAVGQVTKTAALRAAA